MLALDDKDGIVALLSASDAPEWESVTEESVNELNDSPSKQEILKNNKAPGENGIYPYYLLSKKKSTSNLIEQAIQRYQNRRRRYS